MMQRRAGAALARLVRAGASGIAVLLGAALLSACAAPRLPVAANTPTTARAQPYDPLTAAPTGGIFRSNNNIFLFEDRKPRVVGDLLTVQINENLNASQTANSSAEKKTSATATLPKISGVLGAGLNGLNLNAAGDNAYNGTGATASTLSLIHI